MGFLRFLLFPLAMLFDWGGRLRNHLYNIGMKPSVRFDLPVISVGNLNVGGSGKTPMIEYLIRLLRHHYRIATLSRGYGRMTKGFAIAAEADSASSIGDEPFQIFQKFGSEIQVCVGEERVTAIPQILVHHPETHVILLDDAFQHRAIQPSFSILLTRYQRPFFRDWVLPMGNLRESRRGAKRADVVVVTKCDPGLSESQMIEYEQQINRYAPSRPVFFSAIRYAEPVAFGSTKEMGGDVVLISGIAHHSQFESYARSRWNVVKHLALADHFRYEPHHLEAIQREHPGLSLLTTEKDKAKLVDGRLNEYTKVMPWFYLPIEVYFLKNGTEFDNHVKRSISRQHEQV